MKRHPVSVPLIASASVAALLAMPGIVRTTRAQLSTGKPPAESIPPHGYVLTSKPKPIELVAVGLAGCTAFDVITVLRQKFHQKVTSYEVRVEADQAERPPQVFTAVRIHHVVTGLEIDPAAIEEAIRLSEEKYCSVGAMVKQTATFKTTYEIVEEMTAWLPQAPAAVQG